MLLDLLLVLFFIGTISLSLCIGGFQYLGRIQSKDYLFSKSGFFFFFRPFLKRCFEPSSNLSLSSSLMIAKQIYLLGFASVLSMTPFSYLQISVLLLAYLLADFFSELIATHFTL